MDKELILKYIEADRQESARRKRMFDYYRGNHAIRNRCMSDPSKPNNRLVNGYPALISNAYAGYLMGEPVGYAADNFDIDSLNAILKYNDSQAEDCAIAMDLSICGVGVEIYYIDAGGYIRFKRVDPAGCIDVREDTIEENLTCLIRYYDIFNIAENGTERRVEVLDAQVRETYKISTGELELIDSEYHGFGDVPAVVYQNNSERMGDFEGVISLIDAYDLMQSESINDQEYFSDAYLYLKGLDGTDDEDVARMKHNRVLLLPTDSDAGFLIKQQSDQITENIKNRLNNDIHRFSGCPDMTDESFAGNASGVALKYKLLQFENIAGIKEREFKRGLQRRIELICNIWRTLGRGDYDWRNVQISFKRALPENLLENAQTLSAYGGLLSDETKRGMIPIDIDEETEKQRLKEQSEAGLSLFAPMERRMTETVEESQIEDMQFTERLMPDA